MGLWWAHTGVWVNCGSSWRPNMRWEGPEQKEDKSPENIQRCYSFLRSRPFQSAEDRARLTEQELITVTEQKMVSGG